MLFFILLIDTLTVGALTNKPDCMFLVRNDYESPVEVNWIDPSTGGRVLMSNPYIRRGSDFTVHSYVSHTFEFKELPDTQTGKCAGDSTECRVASYTVNQPEKQWLTLDSNFEFQNSDHFMNARNQQSNFKDDCKNQASEAMQSGVAFDQVFERMVDCMEHETMMHLLDASKDVYFEEQLRKRMGSTYENYTCMDFDLPTSDPVDQRTWIDPKSGQKLISLVMLERPASKIHLIENFITEEECVAMEETARPMLRKAVVADGSGGHQESPNRKALQAGIVVPWDKEGQQHPITSISRRVYDYVNYAMGIEIDEHGQENLMSIQYKAENRTGELKYEDYDQVRVENTSHMRALLLAFCLTDIVIYSTYPIATEIVRAIYINTGVVLLPW